jgi:PAS domain-containing protein
MKELLEIDNIDQLMKSYIKDKDGLLAFIQPLIAKIASLQKEKDPTLSFTDITQQYLEAFIKNAPIATAFLDKDLKIVYSSSAWETWIKVHLAKNLKRMSFEELTNYSLPKLFQQFPHRLKIALNYNLKGKSARFDLIDYINIHKQRCSIHWESFPWYDTNGQTLGIMVFCKDISQRQRIFLANKNLNQCNKMLENFSIIFLHDLIQPLRQATNFLTIVEEHLEPTIKNDAFVNHALKAIEKSLAQVRTISEGVAMYCRNGNLTMNSEEVCLKSLIEEVRQSCLDDKRIKMKALIKEPVSIHANRVSLLQLFQNLLGNAVKHADSKMPVITLSGKKVVITFMKFFSTTTVSSHLT